MINIIKHNCNVPADAAGMKGTRMVQRHPLGGHWKHLVWAGSL